MKHPYSRVSQVKGSLLARWSAEDYPGAQPRFQAALFAKDIAVFILLPLVAVVFFKSLENAMTPQRRKAPAISQNRSSVTQSDLTKSQIIDFRPVASGSALSGIARKSPGALVKVRLLNVIETYATAPVHAQVVDSGLGRSWVGGTLIGDAVPDTNFDRITVAFKYVRDPLRDSVAIPLSARALSLDGTLGIDAIKKEGFVTRSAFGSAATATQGGQVRSGSSDFKDMLLQALTAGFLQEFGAGVQIEKNRAHVLSLPSGSEFFAELTEFFPNAGTSR